jgi:hypothetical protein
LKEKRLSVSKKFVDNTKSEDFRKLRPKENVLSKSPLRGKENKKSSSDKEKLKSNVQESPKKRYSLNRKLSLKLLSKSLSLKWSNPWYNLSMLSRHKSKGLAERNARTKDKSDTNTKVLGNLKRLLKRKSKLSPPPTSMKRS